MLAGAVFVVAFVVVGAFAGALLHGRTVWEHDEAITALATTAHEAAWRDATRDVSMVGTALPAARWQAFVEFDGWHPGTVADDLATTDVHPPLYFWLLHAVAWAGVPVRDLAWSVNVVVAACAALVVWLVAARLVRPVPALVAPLLWSAAPVVLASAAELRQYVLVALCAVGLLHGALRVLGSERLARVELGAWSAAALLTNTQLGVYSLVVVVTTALLMRRDQRRALGVVTAFVAGALVALACFPHLVSQARRARDQFPGFALSQVASRAGDWLRRVPDVVGAPAGSLQWPVAIGVCAVLAAVVMVATRSWHRHSEGVDALVVVAIAAVSATALPLAAYALGASPSHALGTHYVLASWTLLVLAGVVLVDRVAFSPRRTYGALAGVVGAVLLISVVQVGNEAHDHAHERATRNGITTATVVVANCPDRGYLPTLLRDLPRDTTVVAGTARRLRLGDWTVPPSARVVVADGSCDARADLDRALAAHGISRTSRLGPLERYDVWNAAHD